MASLCSPHLSNHLRHLRPRQTNKSTTSSFTQQRLTDSNHQQLLFLHFLKFISYLHTPAAPQIHFFHRSKHTSPQLSEALRWREEKHRHTQVFFLLFLTSHFPICPGSGRRAVPRPEIPLMEAKEQKNIYLPRVQSRSDGIKHRRSMQTCRKAEAWYYIQSSNTSRQISVCVSTDDVRDVQTASHSTDFRSHSAERAASHAQVNERFPRLQLRWFSSAFVLPSVNERITNRWKSNFSVITRRQSS